MAVKDKTRGAGSAWERTLGKKSEAVAPFKKRKYAAAEAAAGAQLPERPKRAARHPATVPPRAPKIVRAPVRKKAELGRLQTLVAQTVKQLFMTASPEGDLAFVADVKEEILSDLRVQVGLWGKQIEVTFYTRDPNTRRLVDGYARELRAALEDKRLKVRRIRVLKEPDPSDPPPVPLIDEA